MFSGTIGGIPILWIMMAQSAAALRKKKKNTMVKPKDLGLGDFAIDPVSQQWCRIVKIENVWKDVPPLEGSRRTASDPKSREAQARRDLRVHTSNAPLREFSGEHEQVIASIKEKMYNSHRHSSERHLDKEKFISYKIKLQFADDRSVTRSVGCNHEFTCVRAPEIFSFDFEQLKSLTGNTRRGVKKAKKPAKKKAAKKKAAKKKPAKKKAA